ncbi:hypothetical protein [Streptomyces sp. NPDC052496]|uniref:hypothetical protein n=1 Tax=Streptomyces sp. NPDC052496 TaxID=3154951 RepID=UPI003414EC4C
MANRNSMTHLTPMTRLALMTRLIPQRQRQPIAAAVLRPRDPSRQSSQLAGLAALPEQRRVQLCGTHPAGPHLAQSPGVRPAGPARGAAELEHFQAHVGQPVDAVAARLGGAVGGGG